MYALTRDRTALEKTGAVCPWGSKCVGPLGRKRKGKWVRAAILAREVKGCGRKAWALQDFKVGPSVLRGC